MEILDIIDANDKVIGRTTKEEIYAKKLGHRIVHIFLTHPVTKKLFLQIRGPKKTYLPNHYCTSAAGHVLAGESYEAAAARELEEELGIVTQLRHISTFAHMHVGIPIFIALFSGKHEGPFTYQEEEVSGGDWFTEKQIKAIMEKGDLVHPHLPACFAHWPSLSQHQ